MTIFITFEGPEGSGKTTIISMLSEALKDTNEVMITREPGGIPISEKVRDILLANENGSQTTASDGESCTGSG